MLMTSHNPQEGIVTEVLLVLQMRDLDTGSCWYESDVPQALGVSDIFDPDHTKF